MKSSMNKSLESLTPKVRCAVYTRKSTDEGLDSAFNSLDAQRGYCEKYIQSQEGWLVVPDNYEDGAFSGYTTERPAFQRLLVDIKAGLIDVVVVYRSDRFARSLRDALNILHMFKEHDVSLVSVTERIDTTTPMGKFASQIMFAAGECERDTARERTIHKIDASKKRGMWMGGLLPLGYDSRNKKLVIKGLSNNEVKKL